MLMKVTLVMLFKMAPTIKKTLEIVVDLTIILWETFAEVGFTMIFLAHNFDNVLVKLNLSFVGESERHFLCQTFALCIKRLVKLNPIVNFIDILCAPVFLWK